MIYLDSDQLLLVKAILQKHAPNARFFIFGSRATGRHKPFSDLDLAIDNCTPLESSLLFKIKDEFEESNLPIRVDVLDIHAISDDFKDLIQKDAVELK